MRRRSRWLVVPLACVCWGGAAVLWAPEGTARADEVLLVPGSKFKDAIGGRVRGQVQSESPSEVVVQLGANRIRVPTDQIVSVHYDNQSASYELGESRARAGKLQEAADLFKKAVAETKGRALPHQAALFEEARTLAELAVVEPEQMKEAKGKLSEFVQAHPNSRQAGAAREELARLQILSDDFPGAEATIAALAKLPQGAERAAILRTKVLARQGKHADAIQQLDALIKAAPKQSAAARAAKLAKAESLAALKKYSEAETLAREVIQESPAEDAGAQAPAYNTLGDCLRAANRPKEALVAYLHTDLLYNEDREEHPRALQAISLMFRQLKQDARADEFAKRLKQEYPRSPWIRKLSETR